MNSRRILTALFALAGVSIFVLALASRRESPIEKGESRLATASAKRGRVPVIVELFTSEGCSDCPPADRVLAWLKRTQPAPGAEVIALGEHVDYWNSRSWADPYSSHLFSLRQSEYANVFRLSEVYTPQAVVDGQAEFVGSDQNRAEEAIERAAAEPKANVKLEREKQDSESVTLRIQVDDLPGRSGDTTDVLLAITEDHLSSSVRGGENAGRNLTHVAVVRRLSRIGAAKPQGAFAARTKVDLDSRWKRKDLNAVVFVQERASRRIVGAASIPLE